MSKIIKSTENGMSVVTEIPDDAPRISGNGFGPALLGFPTTIVTIFQQQLSGHSKPDHLERKVVATLEIPTISLLELAQTVQKALRENKAAMQGAMAQMVAFVDKDI
ncbi:hypothetical protein [Paraburkholderia sp. DGU8]|uniref:hypothetical protein n=1 Tax=Paraburkholderia sp. DGU8 TaxID=3161997 RepID=UPI0034655A58